MALLLAPSPAQPPCEIFVKVEMMELCENCGASSIHPVIIHLLPHLHTCFQLCSRQPSHGLMVSSRHAGNVIFCNGIIIII